MVLDKNAVGTACNLIGVDFHAFRYQSEKCGQVVGACLNNQLFDLAKSDDERKASGLQPQYRLSRCASARRRALLCLLFAPARRCASGWLKLRRPRPSAWI